MRPSPPGGPPHLCAAPWEITEPSKPVSLVPLPQVLMLLDVIEVDELLEKTPSVIYTPRFAVSLGGFSTGLTWSQAQ